MKFDRERLLGDATDPDQAGAAVDMAALLGPDKFDEFLRQLEAQLHNFLMLLSAQPPDAEKLRRQTHELVASAGMLGFRAVSDYCAGVEALGVFSAQNIADARRICTAALTEISGRRIVRRAD